MPKWTPPTDAQIAAVTERIASDLEFTSTVFPFEARNLRECEVHAPTRDRHLRFASLLKGRTLSGAVKWPLSSWHATRLNTRSGWSVCLNRSVRSG